MSEPGDQAGKPSPAEAGKPDGKGPVPRLARSPPRRELAGAWALGPGELARRETRAGALQVALRAWSVACGAAVLVLTVFSWGAPACVNVPLSGLLCAGGLFFSGGLALGGTAVAGLAWVGLSLWLGPPEEVRQAAAPEVVLARAWEKALEGGGLVRGARRELFEEGGRRLVQQEYYLPAEAGEGAFSTLLTLDARGRFRGVILRLAPGKEQAGLSAVSALGDRLLGGDVTGALERLVPAVKKAGRGKLIATRRRLVVETPGRGKPENLEREATLPAGLSAYEVLVFYDPLTRHVALQVVPRFGKAE